MLSNLFVYLRAIRRGFSRSYWAIRLFGLSKSEGTETSPGLILIQIDGLAHLQLKKALKSGRLPFLHQLLHRENYVLHSFYSGVPSATPAVQGELFYGVKGCVPSFQFVDDRSEEMFTMYESKSALEIERRLAENHPPLLRGGSSYSNIFRGGASEAHFCATTLEWKGFFRAFRPSVWITFLFFHLDIFFRLAALLVIECVLALYDSIRGILAGQKLWMEIEFILTRVFICIFLRELVVLGAKIDIARGLPIIHVNFVGYDEQSHRRGPSSDFAHWVLRGIDNAIERIWNEAQNANRRDYDLWIYSDHGQAETLPYPMEHKRSFESLAKEISKETPFKVTGMGPLLHVHPVPPLYDEKKEDLIHKLLIKAKIPAILTLTKDDKVQVRTSSACYELPKDAANVLGEDHPFLEEATEDLIGLCHHSSAGNIILSGWIKGEPPRTFPNENGSHAGFGPEETHAFALLPEDAPLPLKKKHYLRALDLREAAFRVLGRSEASAPEWKVPESVTSFRVMTYNVHGCVGMDGKLSPSRIARVIAYQDPDIVAIQELDVKRKRSGYIDQAEFIAKKLGMNYHFHPSYHAEDEKFGNAVFSRYPIRVIRSAALPQLKQKYRWESRGALWIEINLGQIKLNLINTHLSLWPPERVIQAEALAGEGWLGSKDCHEPAILCGDLNALPRSPACRRIGCRLRDVQTILESHRPHPTWFSGYPMHRIDHIFVSHSLEPLRITVPRTALERVASDHMPLIAELRTINHPVEAEV